MHPVLSPTQRLPIRQSVSRGRDLLEAATLFATACVDFKRAEREWSFISTSDPDSEQWAGEILFYE